MFDVKIEEKEGFIIAGRNMQLPIQSPKDIEKLFVEAHASGLIAKLSELSATKTDSVTNATYLGIAKPKEEGGLDYYFAAEISETAEAGDLEKILIPAVHWAIFTSEGADLENIALLEQYAYGEWLREQEADWKLIDVPQMNVFLLGDGKEYTELWLPIMEKKKIVPMKIRPYLTYAGQCTEAIGLYERAFKAELLQLTRLWEMSPSSDMSVSEEEKDLVLQAIMRFGNDFIRMSDCHGRPLNEQETERVSIVVETTPEIVRHAFAVLSEEGRVGIELSEQFYSSCTGVVFDKFGVMWNLVAQP